MFANSRNQRLHLLVVKCPSEAVSIQIAFKYERWSHSEAIKVLAVPVSVEIHTNPMSAGATRRVGVDDDNRRPYSHIGQFVAGVHSAVDSAIFSQYFIDNVAVHLS